MWLAVSSTCVLAVVCATAWTGARPDSIAIGSVAAVLASAGVGDAPPLAITAFTECIVRLQSAPRHAATAAEARKCAPGLPLLRPSSLAGAVPPAFLLERPNGSAVLEWSPVPDRDASLFAILSSCYDTWTNPNPWASDGLNYVSISAFGYGNHCGYANVPTTPTVSYRCLFPGCSATFSAGHYDSAYGQTHFNQNYAAGWANIYFAVVADSWACRAFVNTSGQQNPASWCY